MSQQASHSRQINVLETRTVPNIKQYAVGDYYVDGSQAYKCLQADTATSETDLKPTKLAEGSYWETTSDPKNYEIQKKEEQLGGMTLG